MPKINLEYDTETKQLVCNCDEDEVEMVSQVCFYKDGDQYRMEINMKEEENGMREYTSLVASKQKDSIKFGKYFLVPTTNWFTNVIQNKN